MEIKLGWKYIKYEIDQETWKSAKVRITGDANAEVLNEAQTGIDQFDVNYCYRKVEQGLMNLQDILHKFFVGYRQEKEAPFTIGDKVKVVNGGSTVYGIIVSIMPSPPPITDKTYTVQPDTGGSRITVVGTGNMTYAEESGNNTLDNQSTYWLLDLVFDGRRNVDADLLASELHKYVVYNVLQEWAKMTLPNMAEEYKKRTQEEADRIKAICYRKEVPELDD